MASRSGAAGGGPGVLARVKAIFTRTGVGLTDLAAWRNFAPGGSAAGKTVTFDSALQLDTVWACVKLISQAIATLPLVVYGRNEDGSRSAQPSHPLYELLHDSPNADLTAVEFWEGVGLCLCLGGNAYARKEYSGTRLVALTPLAFDRMQVRRNEAGALEYIYSDRKGRHLYREDQIFHVRGFGGAGDVGLSPIGFARQSMGTAMATEEMAGKVFANGARPSGVLTIDQVLKPDQRKALADNIVKPFVGSEQAGGVMVLEGGVKWQAVTMNMDDAQFLQTRQFQVTQMCRWFGIPPFMVGHSDGSSNWGTGLEQQLLAFLTFGLNPFLERIEQRISKSLISPTERKKIFAEFNRDAMMRTDSAARASFYQVMVQNGLMTRNEVRRLQNLPPLPGGDELTVQSQNVPLGTYEPPKMLAPPPAANA